MTTTGGDATLALLREGETARSVSANEVACSSILAASTMNRPETIKVSHPNATILHPQEEPLGSGSPTKAIGAATVTTLAATECRLSKPTASEDLELTSDHKQGDEQMHVTDHAAISIFARAPAHQEREKPDTQSAIFIRESPPSCATLKGDDDQKVGKKEKETTPDQNEVNQMEVNHHHQPLTNHQLQQKMHKHLATFPSLHPSSNLPALRLSTRPRTGTPGHDVEERLVMSTVDAKRVTMSMLPVHDDLIKVLQGCQGTLSSIHDRAIASLNEVFHTAQGSFQVIIDSLTLPLDKHRHRLDDHDDGDQREEQRQQVEEEYERTFEDEFELGFKDELEQEHEKTVDAKTVGGRHHEERASVDIADMEKACSNSSCCRTSNSVRGNHNDKHQIQFLLRSYQQLQPLSSSSSSVTPKRPRSPVRNTDQVSNVGGTKINNNFMSKMHSSNGDRIKREASIDENDNDEHDDEGQSARKRTHHQSGSREYENVHRPEGYRKIHSQTRRAMRDTSGAEESEERHRHRRSSLSPDRHTASPLPPPPPPSSSQRNRQQKDSSSRSIDRYVPRYSRLQAPPPPDRYRSASSRPRYENGRLTMRRR